MRRCRGVRLVVAGRRHRFGMASAGGSASDASTFGLSVTSETPRLEASSAETSTASSDFAREDSVLTSTAQRDMSSGIQAIEAQEEAERLAAEEAARLAEEQRQRELAAAQQKQQEKASQDAASGALADASRSGLERGQGNVHCRMDGSHRRLSGGFAPGGAGRHVRHGRMEQRRRSALVAGHFQHRKLEGGALLPAAQRMGLGAVELVELGRGHQRATWPVWRRTTGTPSRTPTPRNTARRTTTTGSIPL